MTSSALLSVQTELAQLRRLERIADSDLVRLTLSAWATLVSMCPEAATFVEDLPAIISNQSRRTLRTYAAYSLGEARWRIGMAEHWEESGRVDFAAGFRFEAMVYRFRAVVLLEAAKTASHMGPPRVSRSQREAWTREGES
jgi:hypothetical protein